MSDSLDESAKDKLLALVKGAIGSFPYGGSFIAELLTITIPNQRQDRVVIFLRKLAERLDMLEGQSGDILSRPDKVDFVEEGGRQAARALSPQRIGYIVEAVSRGLTSEEAEVIRRKRLLTLLGELDDDELAMLNAYGQAYGQDMHEVREVWEGIDRPEPASLDSTTDEVDREELFEAGNAHLLRLGLLKKQYPFLRRGELPEFDKDKGEFQHELEVSYLGRMLLREIGLPSAFDLEQEQYR